MLYGECQIRHGIMWLVVRWLDKHGVVCWGQHIRSEYITGTAITIVVAFLILLVKPGKEGVTFPVYFGGTRFATIGCGVRGNIARNAGARYLLSLEN